MQDAQACPPPNGPARSGSMSSEVSAEASQAARERVLTVARRTMLGTKNSRSAVQAKRGSLMSAWHTMRFAEKMRNRRDDKKTIRMDRRLVVVASAGVVLTVGDLLLMVHAPASYPWVR